jgi:hypothetical protein
MPSTLASRPFVGFWAVLVALGLSGCGADDGRTRPRAKGSPTPHVSLPPDDAVLRAEPFCDELDATKLLGGPANQGQQLEPGDRYTENGKKLRSLTFTCVNDRKQGSHYPGFSGVFVWPDATASKKAPRTLEELNASIGKRCEASERHGFDLAVHCEEPARNTFYFLRFTGDRAFQCLAGSDSREAEDLEPDALEYCAGALRVVTGT